MYLDSYSSEETFIMVVLSIICSVLAVIVGGVLYYDLDFQVFGESLPVIVMGAFIMHELRKLNQKLDEHRRQDIPPNDHNEKGV